MQAFHRVTPHQPLVRSAFQYRSHLHRPSNAHRTQPEHQFHGMPQDTVHLSPQAQRQTAGERRQPSLRQVANAVNSGRLSAQAAVKNLHLEQRQQQGTTPRALLRQVDTQLLNRIQDPKLRSEVANRVVSQLRGDHDAMNLFYGLPREGHKRNDGVIDPNSPVDYRAVDNLVRAGNRKGRETIFGVDAGMDHNTINQLHQHGAKVASKVNFKELRKVLGHIGPNDPHRQEKLQKVAADLAEKLGQRGADYLQVDELPSNLKNRLTRNTVGNLAGLLRAMEKQGNGKKLIFWGRFGAPPRPDVVQAYKPFLQEARLSARSVAYETYASPGSRNQRALFADEVRRRGPQEIEQTVDALDRVAPGVASATVPGLGVFSGGNLPGGLPGRNSDDIVTALVTASERGTARWGQGEAFWSLARRPDDRSAEQFTRFLASLI